MDKKAYEGEGVVVMNPLGPHFEVRVEAGEAPPDLVDLVTDRMNHWLSDLDEEYEWNVTHEHVKPHTPICRIEWYPDQEGYGRDYDADIHLPRSIEMDWYSQSANPVGDDL